jgi:hypothetical protein
MTLILPTGAKPAPKETTPSYDSLTEEQKAALDALAEKENPEDHYPTVETAFVVIKHPDGAFSISNDLSPKIAPKREADENDYLAAFEIIKANLHAQMSAVLVQQGMMQQAAMMQHHMQNQQIQSRLKL